jgi:DNA-binding transcriptional regulator YhcF (GntR family)
MIVTIDFNSGEAIYLQLCNQIIMLIAAEEYREGDTLPSVRQLAENIGINMHTVNKAYTILKQEGFLRLDRRRGAVVSLNADKRRALEDMNQELRVVLAKARCKSISCQEVHNMVDQIYYEYLGGNPNVM